MSKRSKALTFIMSSLFLFGMAAGGYWLLRKTQPHICPICQRDIHPRSRAVLLLGKARVAVCCVRCGITHNLQVGKPGELVEVTEYLSNKPMKPDAAFYVEGSQVSHCDPHQGALVDQTKRPYNRIFDRCEPSTYAFARREDADTFMRENGGKVLTWEGLKKEGEVRP